MEILNQKRCIIGEGPIWNENEGRLYFTNGIEGKICTYDLKNKKLDIIPFGAAAIAFDSKNKIYLSTSNGVFMLNPDNTLSVFYDTSRFNIKYANDMKAGPDGALYVGTQSGKRKGVSDKTDGKLYRISPEGNVKVLLDGLILSNGMEWSLDEKKFYHTDSDTNIIKEYDFDKISGDITFTGRQIEVQGVDGFTIDSQDRLIVACWGQGHIAVVDTETLEIVEYIDTPCKIPASCAFCGDNMDILAITTANYGIDIKDDENAGFTLLHKMNVKGRKSYIFKR